jgi:transposase
MWAPFRQSIEQWAPQCKIVYDKFHIVQHANDAIDEVRKTEFFRQGKQKRGLIKGKKWLLLSRRKNLTLPQRGEFEPALPTEPARLQSLHAQGELGRDLGLSLRRGDVELLAEWMDPLKWQRLTPFEDLADMLLDHLEDILNYCKIKARFGVVEAHNGNIRMRGSAPHSYRAFVMQSIPRNGACIFGSAFL